MKLKPCPFCGGDAEVVVQHKNIRKPYVVVCKDGQCMASIGNFSITKEDAIEAWNRREPIDKIVEQLEKQKDNKFELRDDTKSDVMTHFYDGQVVAFIKAIEIVKGGAV